MERARPRERVAAVLAGLEELESLRHTHETLVRSALRVEARSLPDKQTRHRSPEERSAQENLGLLRRQLDCLRSRDAALISQLQELDRQISSLRLDRDESHDQEVSSRPSSGFYDLSDASLSLSNSSNSVFSECLSSCQSASCVCPAHCCLEGRANMSGGLSQDWEGVVSPPVVSCVPPLTQTRLPRPLLPPPPPPAAPLPSQRRLDLYILSLLQRRTPPRPPVLPRTRPRSSPAAPPAPGPRSAPAENDGGVAPVRRSPAHSGQEGEKGGSRGAASVRTRRRRVVTATKVRSSSRESLSSAPRRHRRGKLDPAPGGRPPRTKRTPEGVGPRGHSRQGGRHGNRPGGGKRPGGRGRSDSEYSAECCALLDEEDLMVDRPPLQSGGGGAKGGAKGGACGRGRGCPGEQEERSFVKIKASHNLKKKILRFRTGSLKLMTTV